MTISNSYQGQIQILDQLRSKVISLKSYTARFTVAYSDHLQKARAFDMMSETVGAIQRKGLPIYEASVRESDGDLDAMLNLIEANKQELMRLIQAAQHAEDNL